ncbi:hypothetical protein [uncultured Psychroserpens sp.]|uniref:hypothetical protein n=1 Tax=uncultured Psychroserpens sp. TaxID=255436 RepID=UPI00260311A4|nr:hypothetical protein [uncultured Psychroserpens sp.]
MKTKLLFVIIFSFAIHWVSAQVGIGTTEPKASLDVASSDMTNPSNTDGLLIPKIDNFPSTNPGTDQDGMMVFVTGNGVPAKGFYYWNNGTTSWVNIQGIQDTDWLGSGTGAPANNITDNIYTLGQVQIGSVSATNTSSLRVTSDLSSNFTGLELLHSGSDAGKIGYGIYNQSTISNAIRFSNFYNINSGTHNAAHYGFENFFINNGTGEKVGLYNEFDLSAPNGNKKGVYNRFEGGNGTVFGLDNNMPAAWSITGTVHGINNNIRSNGNSQHYGVRTELAGLGSGNKYGYFVDISSTAGGTHYGIFSDVRNVSGFAAYFRGRVSFGTEGIDRYVMPTQDGSTNQVITTDGFGQLSFTSIPTGVEKIDDLIDAKSDSDGTDDGSSIFFGLNAGASDDSSNNFNVGIGYDALTSNISGTLNVAVGWGSLSANIANSNTAIGYLSAGGNTTGINNTAIGRNALLANDTGDNNTAVGFYAGWQARGTGNVFLGANSGFNQAVVNNKLFIENSDANEDNALIYGDFGSDNTTIGNMLRVNGELQIGNPILSGYVLPILDGTSGQVMTTDGAGNITFQNSVGDGIGTDDQTVDTFGLIGDTIGISIEDDGQPVQTVDLSNLSFNVNNFALAKIRMSADQVPAIIGASNKVNFDTVEFDTNSNFNTTLDRFEVTQAGYYRIDASLCDLTNTSTSVFGIQIRVNGVIVKTTQENHSGSGILNLSVSSIQELSANDYVEIYVFVNGAMTITSNNTRTSFEVERIR